ncbi:RIKEN cDNA 4932414K18, isoform CRA_a, partial [Mus musculus]
SQVYRAKRKGVHLYANTKRIGKAHVLWNIFVPRCLSVCVHPASFKSLSGAIQAPHSALLWLKTEGRSTFTSFIGWSVVAQGLLVGPTSASARTGV